MAHGEGRFTSAQEGRVEALAARGQVPLRYARADGSLAGEFPANPNGAEAAAAAVCNPAGNVLAIMPHPERAQDLGAMPSGIVGAWADARVAARVRGERDAEGPGMTLFAGLARHLEEG
jgi:phosphoribosylformylglycinamidine synthase